MDANLSVLVRSNDECANDAGSDQRAQAQAIRRCLAESAMRRLARSRKKVKLRLSWKEKLGCRTVGGKLAEVGWTFVDIAISI